jgi:trimeric autotransporter adhesin
MPERCTFQAIPGLYAVAGTGPASFAGWFNGDVNVDGSLSKSSGSFKIDDPLDPAKKYLYHSFVESPDMKNIYDGTVVTDGSGTAVVSMPAWFEALNTDFVISSP